MEVILTKDVDKIGKEGEILHVKDGFARNYLLPRKLAVVSSPAAVKAIENKKRKSELEAKRMKDQAEVTASRIANLSCTIPVEAGVSDKIFGTVTPEMVRNALRQEGIELDKRDISIDGDIDKLGVYQVKIKIHPEVTANLRIWIVKK